MPSTPRGDVIDGGKRRNDAKHNAGQDPDNTTDASMDDSNQSALEEDSVDVGTNTEDEAASQAATNLGATVASDTDDDCVDEDEYYEDDDGESDENQAQGLFTTHRVPIIGNTPPPKHASGSIPRTRFSGEYRSTLTREFALHAPKLLPLLAHVNCSYLSTYGLAPTLTELKQHAQSLIVLIKALTISTNSAFIDNRNLKNQMNDAAFFHDGQTYDFLNDLSNHYWGPQRPELVTHHSLPLNAALNTVETAQVIPTQTACVCAASKQAPMPASNGGKHPRARGSNHGGPVRGIPAYEILRDICPLHSSFYTPINGPSLPYAQHQALISHANEALELLDHEYSAKGGLLSILPPKEQVEDRKKAETTLLGQLILYMQRLVQRVHDLERLYANATDALASEAVVPMQTLSRLGPDGRKGRELVYPQDRFVLVNAGEDVFSFLSHEFDKKDLQDEEVMKNYKRFGTTGEAVWEQRGGREYSRGITAIDVVTRYYRIRGSEKQGRSVKTIFIIPAHAEHPGVAVTRELEKQPTVVSVVRPVWPERQSIWEMKHRSDLQDLKVFKRENQKMKSEKEIDDNAKTLLQYELDLKKGEIMKLKLELEAKNEIIYKPGNEAQAKLFETYVTKANENIEEADKLREANEADRAATQAARAEAEALRNQLRQQTQEYEKGLAIRLAQEKADRARCLEKIIAADEADADATTELEEKLKEKWQKQIQETQAIIEYLKSKKIEYLNDAVPEKFAELGKKNGESIFKSAVSGKRSVAQKLGKGLGLGLGGQTFLDPDAVDKDGEDSDDLSMYDCDR